MTASERVYNWGIMGCGLISNDFCNCLDAYERANIVACASRSLEKSQKFASKFGIDRSKAYSSYEDLARDPLVEVIYIGNLQVSHYKCVLLALKNKKHVLCEKPLGMNATEVQLMIEAARENKRFFMEGVWTRFFPAMRRARELVEDGTIGDVHYYAADFGIVIPATPGARVWQKNLGGGSLMDLGCYAINALTWVFGPGMPDKINAVATLSEQYKIDTMTAATIVYKGNRFAQVNSCLFCNTTEKMAVAGTKGIIQLEYPFHSPTELTLKLFEENGRAIKQETKMCFKFPEKKWKTPFSYSGGQGFTYEAEEVTRCLDRGMLQSDVYTWEEMLTCARIIDRIRYLTGNDFPHDRYDYANLNKNSNN